MRTVLPGLFILGVLLPFVASCSREERVEHPPAGSAFGPYVHYRYALFLTAAPDDFAATVADLARNGFFSKVEAIEEKPRNPQFSITVIENPTADYEPPDAEALRHFGRGLDKNQVEAVQNTKRVLLLEFTYPSSRVWEGLRNANELALLAAEKTEALIWDEETREMFSPDAWRKMRLESSNEPIPELSDHITIHAYNNGEYARAITLGMAKFALPDVVVEEFSWANQRPVGNLINAVCQSLAEGGQIGAGGRYELDLRGIRNEQSRTSQLENPLEGATHQAKFRFAIAKPDDGDPENRIIALRFDDYDAPDVHARQEAALTSMYGASDSVKSVRHTDELLAASAKARKHLPALAAAFSAGLQPGENIQVKAPFPRPDGGDEWMWVEVTDWNGKRIRGLLRNEPFEIPKLHAGQSVNVNEDDVFDYIHTFADGRTEGNTTSEILMRQ